jgi:small nuclear ribonucleoprotein (snRNP)-like protein
MIMNLALDDCYETITSFCDEIITKRRKIESY